MDKMFTGFLSFVSGIVIVKPTLSTFRGKRMSLQLFVLYYKTLISLIRYPNFLFFFSFLFSLNVKGIPFTLNKGEMRKASLTGYWEFNTQIPSKLYGVLLRITLHT